MVTLVAVSGAAAAAPARHRKHSSGAHRPAAKRGSSPPSSPAIADTGPVDDAAQADDGASPAAPTIVKDPTGAPAAPFSRPAVAAEVTGDAPRAVTERASAIAIASGPDDVERELGRREAARLAAGRFEVAVMAGLDVGRRDFTFSDPVGDQARPYRLAAAPLASLALEMYPLASSGVPLVRDLGLQGHFSRAFAVGSSTSAGAALGTSWTRFGGDLRQRLLLGGAHQVELGGALGLDASYFELRAPSSVGALLPSSRMVSLRLGLDARARLAGRLSLLGGGGYLITLARGEIFDHFRDPSVAGIDAVVGASLLLAPGLELCVQGRYTRYFARFQPQVGDATVAGGALDEQFQLGMGIRHAH